MAAKKTRKTTPAVTPAVKAVRSAAAFKAHITRMELAAKKAKKPTARRELLANQKAIAARLATFQKQHARELKAAAHS